MIFGALSSLLVWRRGFHICFRTLIFWPRNESNYSSPVRLLRVTRVMSQSIFKIIISLSSRVPYASLIINEWMDKRSVISCGLTTYAITRHTFFGQQGFLTFLTFKAFGVFMNMVNDNLETIQSMPVIFEFNQRCSRFPGYSMEDQICCCNV